MNPNGDDPFLGHGKITVTDMQVKTPSINAVPDEALIYIDRRMTFGETKEEAIAQIQRLIPESSRGRVSVEMLYYDEPSYTGFVFPVEKYFPAWALEEQHPLVQAGLRARSLIDCRMSRLANGASPRMVSTGRAKRAFHRLALGQAMKSTRTV